MLRFIKHNLTGIDGVSIYPIISLLIFVIFFVVMLWFVMKMNKKRIEELSDLPFDGEEQHPFIN